jgi:hypothetical protein
MTIAIVRDPIYRGRRFQPEIIELCVRWYLTYRLSYRDLVEMLAERGVVVSHTTIYRWVQQYVPEFERRWFRYAKPVHPSWRVDETAISVRGGQRYLYRAVASNIIATATPAACERFVIKAACLVALAAPYSTMAAVEGPALSPTPTPIKARAANSHATFGASAKINVPTSEAATPASMVARRPT